VDGARMLFDLRKCFFLDRCDDHIDSPAPGGLEHKERKLSVPGDQAEST
jgi:hypothetical protein